MRDVRLRVREANEETMVRRSAWVGLVSCMVLAGALVGVRGEGDLAVAFGRGRRNKA